MNLEPKVRIGEIFMCKLLPNFTIRVKKDLEKRKWYSKKCLNSLIYSEIYEFLFLNELNEINFSPNLAIWQRRMTKFLSKVDMTSN